MTNLQNRIYAFFAAPYRLTKLTANKHRLATLSIKYEEISERLKAYRIGAGLSVEELASKAEISRAALYRFEKGHVAKFETLERLASLLNVSMPTLLGVGIEYLPSPASYFERVGQIERNAEHISVIAGPIPFLLSSDEFNELLPKVLKESIPVTLPDRAEHFIHIESIVASLLARKEHFKQRRPALLSIISAREVRRLLRNGFVGNSEVQGEELSFRRDFAKREVAHLADVIDDERVGTQIGLLTESLPYTGFQIFRVTGKKVLAISPFRLGVQPNVRVGVAMLTSADDGVRFHETAAHQMWRDAIKGREAAHYLRRLIEETN